MNNPINIEYYYNKLHGSLSRQLPLTHFLTEDRARNIVNSVKAKNDLDIIIQNCAILQRFARIKLDTNNNQRIEAERAEKIARYRIDHKDEIAKQEEEIAKQDREEGLKHLYEYAKKHPHQAHSRA